MKKALFALFTVLVVSAGLASGAFAGHGIVRPTTADIIRPMTADIIRPMTADIIRPY